MSPRRRWLNILFFVFVGIGVVGSVFGLVRFNRTILANLPPIDPNNLQSVFSFSQSSTITDRNGKKLYKLFDENRVYISLDQMSNFLLDAAIATEDKTFWTNDGLDYRGIVRAVRDQILVKLGRSVTAGGASTITQQLVRNLLLTRDMTYVRKLKEMVLTYKLYDALDYYMAQRFPDLSKTEKKRKQKELVLELYLNFVFLGNNAYGAEIASQTYFRKSAKDLTIFEAATLAGIIQRPSFFNPYTNRVGTPSSLCRHTNTDNCLGVVGGLHVVSQGESVSIIGTPDYNEAVAVVVRYLSGLNLDISADNRQFLEFMRGEKTFDVEINGTIYSFSYVWGRKDTVLSRMYAEEKISGSDYIQAVLDGLTATFYPPRMDIQAPHFVFWVKDFLLTSPQFADLALDEEDLTKGGYVIRTSLDLDLQKKAEEIVLQYKQAALARKATNRALLYADSQNGDILTYVGSLDYFDEEIDGSVDMIRAPRHPGSTIKPFVYAYGIQNHGFTIDTPFFDIPLRVGPNTPGNADGKFVGLQSLREALAGSRNIPAIKAYFAVGEQQKLIPFLRSLGMTSIRPTHDYGYALSLGAVELPMIELAQAYAHLSALGDPAIFNPILDIRDAEGNLIYERKVERKKRVIEQGPAYLIWKILSENIHMPAGWANTLRVPGLPTGTKSGTSNMRDKDNISRARDGRLVTYTPSRVVVAWVGNSNGAPMGPNAFGELNAPVVKDFFAYLIKEQKIDSSQTHRQIETTSLSINKITGLLPSSSTPESLIVQTLGYVHSLPKQVDPQFTPISVDSLCNGMVSDFTPPEEVVTAYVVASLPSVIPSQRDRADIITWLAEGNVVGTGNKRPNVSYNLPLIFLTAPNKPCEERIPKIDEAIRIVVSDRQTNRLAKRSRLSVNVFSPRVPITRVLAYLDDRMIGQQQFSDTVNPRAFSLNVTLPSGVTQGRLRLVALNSAGYSNEWSQNITVVQDTTPPVLGEVGVTQDAADYRVRITFVDEVSGVDNGMIIMQGAKTQSFRGDTVEVRLSQLAQIGYKIIDGAGNETSGLIQLSDYATSSSPDVPPSPESQTPVPQSSSSQSGQDISSSSSDGSGSAQ
ncbi:MAG: transglycosylase domain-containing protein [Candidatus Absconditabacterales bacterium]|nr:transglycosylase domain-containing protein [Candidatus Absconditabacterales bacterium]